MPKIIINLIQDIATPHNNVLIEQFFCRTDVEIKLWYSQAKNEKRYQWTSDLSNEYGPSIIYGKKLNLSFIRYCLAHRNERFIIVGWANINTRLLHLLFFFLRRKYNHWTDLPDPREDGITLKHKLLRRASYRLLRYSNCIVFCVGKMTIDQFRSWGFPKKMLVNLPIFVSVDDDTQLYKSKKRALLDKYSVPDDGFLIAAGSRLVFEKGYDLLILAITELPSELQKKIKLVIVGSGEEILTLNCQIELLGLSRVIKFTGWLDIQEFKEIIANADIFIHPARFDSYGGTTLGMALGVPVIGSMGAGAAVDRIKHGVNGFLYEPTDTKALSIYIARLLQFAELRHRIGEAGRQTAMQWHPSRGVDIITEHSI